MNPFSALIGGAKELFTSSTEGPPTHIVTPLSQKHRSGVRLLYAILVILLIAILVMVVRDNQTQKAQIKAMSDDITTGAANTAILFAQTNTMVPIINSIGMRVNNLDKQTATIIQVVTPVNKNGFQGRKSSFTPNAYLAELAFYKNLSPSEQSEYLNMSKEDKRTKYSSLKSI